MAVYDTTRPRPAALSGLIALIIALGTAPAWAPGSLSLHDLQIAVRSARALIGEINSELTASGLAAENVVCWASRHGNHWRYLAGRRAAPYECTFGERTLSIEATTIYYDVKGRPLGTVDSADPRRAKSFREMSFHWTWSP